MEAEDVDDLGLAKLDARKLLRMIADAKVPPPPTPSPTSDIPHAAA
jgi:hypothetical protein